MKKDSYGRYIYSEDCKNHKKDWTLEDIRFCMRIRTVFIPDPLQLHKTF